MKRFLLALLLCMKEKSSAPYRVWYPASKRSGIKTLLPIFPRVLIVSKARDERTGQYVVGCVTFKKFFWPTAEAHRVSIPDAISDSIAFGSTKFLYPTQIVETESERYEELLKDSLLDHPDVVHMLRDEVVSLEEYHERLAVLLGDGTELPPIFA